TAHLPNVVVFEGGKYVISSATFPTYFMKDYQNLTYAQAKLDVTIFLKYIVPVLGINRRYVGTEPYCPVTAAYNKAMEEILVKNGIELHRIPRKEIGDKAISASTVRQCIRENDFETLKKLVPPTTYEFLTSDNPEAKKIIEKIKHNHSRH
ncbi:MAG: [citrate (pro-3S)-lyase] ligase, partial [Candidatus Heimdallarchaeaceae archaeon]